MFKRTVKNASRLKWFSFAMWMFCNVLIVWLGYLGSKNQICDVPSAIVSIIVLSVMWLFWFYAYMAFRDIQDEIEAKKGAVKSDS